jgi:1-acyl-sn-glycerol-3-phosphate acyltransferase
MMFLFFDQLIVFPEGTRNHAKGLSMLPFKKGAFHVALGTLLNSQSNPMVKIRPRYGKSRP